MPERLEQAEPSEPSEGPETAAGNTNWLTIAALVLALLIGTGVLISALAFSFQRYFEYQV